MLNNVQFQSDPYAYPTAETLSTI